MIGRLRLLAAALLLAGCGASPPDEGPRSCLSAAGTCAEWPGPTDAVCGYSTSGAVSKPLPRPCPGGARAGCRLGDHVIWYYADALDDDAGIGLRPPPDCQPVTADRTDRD